MWNIILRLLNFWRIIHILEKWPGRFITSEINPFKILITSFWMIRRKYQRRVHSLKVLTLGKRNRTIDSDIFYALYFHKYAPHKKKYLVCIKTNLIILYPIMEPNELGVEVIRWNLVDVQCCQFLPISLQPEG